MDQTSVGQTSVGQTSVGQTSVEETSADQTSLTREQTHAGPETAILSQPALASDWNRPEEDEAWAHVQRAS